NIGNAPTVGANFIKDFTQKNRAGCAFELRVGIREMLPNVTKPRGTEKRIDDRVDDDVAVTMGNWTDAVRDDDPTEQKLPTILETMDVVAVADAKVHISGHVMIWSSGG